MDEKITSQFEGVLCIYRDGELAAIVQKPNGHVTFHTVERMGFEEIGTLFGANPIKNE